MMSTMSAQVLIRRLPCLIWTMLGTVIMGTSDVEDVVDRDELVLPCGGREVLNVDEREVYTVKGEEATKRLLKS